MAIPQLLSALFATLILTACATQSPKQLVDAAAPLSVPMTTAVDGIDSLWKGAVCTAPEEALTRLDALLARTPDNASALALRGLALSQQGQREAAFDSLTAAIRLTPTAQFYAWRSLVLLRGGNARAARHDAQYALRKDKGQPVAVMVVGALELEQGNTRGGCAALAQACAAGECSGLDSARAANQCPQ